MKTKAQKGAELEEARGLLAKSDAVVFIDFAKVRTSDLKNLRRELKRNGNPLFITKKRLIGLLFKEKGVEIGQNWKTQVGTVFVSDMEVATASIYKFFAALQKEKKIESLNILGGYDVKNNVLMEAERVVAIGKLPPREVLLAQLLGMLAAPIRSFLYVLSEKSKQPANA